MDRQLKQTALPCRLSGEHFRRHFQHDLQHATASRHMTGWRIIVCGGRDWLGREKTFAALDYAVQTRGAIGAIIHGATSDFRKGRSADWLAEDWAYDRSLCSRSRFDRAIADNGLIDVERYPVDHSLDGPWPAAGHRRNERMLRLAVERGGVHGGIGFPGGRGTAGMCAALEKAGIPVWRPYG